MKNKKEKAFKSKDIAKWELNSEDLVRVKTLMENKAAAYKAMFPRDNLELITHRDNYYFVANYCYSEIRRNNRYNMFKMKGKRGFFINSVDFC